MFIGCSEVKIVEKGDFVDETEPNDQGFQANEIKEGNNYRAKIAKPAGETPDKDVFKIWKPAGTLITFEFESDKSSFQPYIGHTDNLAHVQFVTFKTPGKFRAEFITSIDGWQYFEIGDRRNTSDQGPFYGEFTYYFRIISKHICDENSYAEIKDTDVISRSFENGLSSVDILKMNIEENGIYQLRVQTEETFSDKFTFVFNCDAGTAVAGSDDEDYYSNLVDPLIYSTFESNLKNLVITGRLLTDLDETGIEKFTVSLTKQPPDRELEPNNLFNYANFLLSDTIDGMLSKEMRLILGEMMPDQDWFRIDLTKGEIIDFSIQTENGGTFLSEIWAGSYAHTGTTILPLRFNRLSGNETHRMNMMMPFSGTVYLLLEGKDISYSINKIVKHSDIAELKLFNETVYEIIEPGECEWQFFKWNMPEKLNFFEISLESLTNKGGIHIFNNDHKPHLFLEPSEENRFFFHRYDKTESLFFGIYFENCEPDSAETMKFKITDTYQNFTEWEDSNLQHAVEFMENGSYQGFFDTDALFYENFFEIEVPFDGTLYLSTAPFRETTSFDIDTVITLYQGKEPVAQNDDAISFINFNKYSYLKHRVKKGEKYLVKVTPFMSESSHIPSMKITGHYILDIIIK